MNVKSCEECSYFKEYVNRQKMEEQKTDRVIYYFHCEHQKTLTEISDLSQANTCDYYDDDVWIK